MVLHFFPDAEAAGADGAVGEEQSLGSFLFCPLVGTELRPLVNAKAGTAEGESSIDSLFSSTSGDSRGFEGGDLSVSEADTSAVAGALVLPTDSSVGGVPLVSKLLLDLEGESTTTN